MSPSSAFLALFFAVHAPVVHAKKNTAFGLKKLAAVCIKTAKGGKKCVGNYKWTIVCFCVEYDFAQWARGPWPTPTP